MIQKKHSSPIEDKRKNDINMGLISYNTNSNSNQGQGQGHGQIVGQGQIQGQAHSDNNSNQTSNKSLIDLTHNYSNSHTNSNTNLIHTQTNQAFGIQLHQLNPIIPSPSPIAYSTTTLYNSKNAFLNAAAASKTFSMSNLVQTNSQSSKPFFSSSNIISSNAANLNNPNGLTGPFSTSNYNTDENRKEFFKINNVNANLTNHVWVKFYFMFI